MSVNVWSSGTVAIAAVAMLTTISEQDALAGSKYEINQNLVEIRPRPICVGRDEAIRYGVMLQRFMADAPATSNISDAINATAHRTAGHGGAEYNCYVIQAKPVYFASPADVIDVVADAGAPSHSTGNTIYLGRADVIDQDGNVLTRDNVGDDIYAMSLGTGEITKAASD